MYQLAFGVASSSSAASKSLEEKKEDPKIKKQSEARKHGLEIQVKVLPIMATLIQSLHGSKFGDIKKDGYHTYLVNADGSLFYSKKIAFNKDGKKSDSLQRMFPTDLEVVRCKILVLKILTFLFYFIFLKKIWCRICRRLQSLLPSAHSICSRPRWLCCSIFTRCGARKAYLIKIQG